MAALCRCALRATRAAVARRSAAHQPRRAAAVSSRVGGGGGGGASDAGGAYVLLPDEALLKECSVATLRGSGPGGQHRNKTETGVRLTHDPTGVRGEAFEERSQQRNREAALRRLRMKLALELRAQVELPEEEGQKMADIPAHLAAILPSAKQRLGANHPDFAKGVSALLDVLSAAGWRPPVAAKALGCTSSALIKIVGKDKAVLAKVNAERQRAGLKPLKASR